MYLCWDTSKLLQHLASVLKKYGGITISGANAHGLGIHVLDSPGTEELSYNRRHHGDRSLIRLPAFYTASINVAFHV